MRFGRMLLICREKSDPKWGWFVCRCGSLKKMMVSSIRSGCLRSCGCMKKEQHGMTGTPIYRVWSSLRNRCDNPNNRAYPNYGGRGITYDESWSAFSKFYSDMGDVPEGCELDRIDNSKGYSKDNCRWATSKTNNRNRRSNVFATIDGVTRTLIEWSEVEGAVEYATITQRIRKGWEPKSAVFQPIRWSTRKKELQDEMPEL